MIFTGVRHYCHKCGVEIWKNKEWQRLHDHFSIEDDLCVGCITKQSFSIRAMG